jgi:hypothetical protein
MIMSQQPGTKNQYIFICCPYKIQMNITGKPNTLQYTTGNPEYLESLRGIASIRCHLMRSSELPHNLLLDRFVPAVYLIPVKLISEKFIS